MNLSKKQILYIIVFVILLIAIPSSLYLVRQQQILKSRAEFTTVAEFVDSAGNVITTTENRSVKLRIRPVATTTPPTVTTGSATNITSTSVTINGTVNPNGLATSVWAQLTTASVSGCLDVVSWTSYASSSAGSGITSASWSKNITGLSPATVYYYCVVAQNAASTNSIYGNPPQSFTTTGQ